MWEKAKRFIGILGPGLVTGAADDDPSGIATYSQTGAQFGYNQLWLTPLMLPMMIAIQEVCARMAIVSGRGIAGIVGEYYSRAALYVVVGLLLIANTINLGAMAAASRLLVPLPSMVLVVFFGLFSIALEVFVSYHTYARYLRYLSISLFAYVLTGFVVTQDWREILARTLVPRVEWSSQFLMIVVAVLGTTISPYMFFWQASQELEEEVERGEWSAPQTRFTRRGPMPKVSAREIRNMRIDTWSGMIFSQVATWFIIVTAAGSLHAGGITDIATAADAARALQPLVHTFPHAGQIAQALFAVGIVGLGLMAVPIFAGSASYALAETFGWREGLFRRPSDAKPFYGVMAAAILVGIAINLVGINPMKALVYTAVINGVVAVPLIFIILLIGSNRRIMGEYTSGFWSNLFGWITFLAMAAAAVLMFATWRRHG